MTFTCIKNDCKRFLNSKSLILLISLLPIVLLLILSYTMENVVAPSENMLKKQESTLLYNIQADASPENQQEFKNYQEFMNTHNAGSLKFQEETNAQQAQELVQKQKAVGYITIDAQKVNYYRSPFNETDSGKQIRSTFENYFGKTQAIANTTIDTEVIHEKAVDSKDYFTFATLGFAILYIALVTSNLTYQEKQQKTILRFFLSKASMMSFLIGKTVLGILIAAYQFLLVFIVGHFLLGVDFGAHLPSLFFLYVCFGAMSSLLGIFVGLGSKTAELASGWVLMIAILIGLLGGGLVPLNSLEGNNIVRILTMISPLRWLTKASVELSRNIVSSNLYISLIISLVIATIFFILARTYVANKERKGVLINV